MDEVSARTMQEAACNSRQKAEELARTAADAIDSRRDRIAGALHRTASTLHTKAGVMSGGQQITRMTHTAAEKLELSAQYIRDRDVRQIMSDMRHKVLRNPGASLLAAGFAGFLVGRALRRD